MDEIQAMSLKDFASQPLFPYLLNGRIQRPGRVDMNVQ